MLVALAGASPAQHLSVDGEALVGYEPDRRAAAVAAVTTLGGRVLEEVPQVGMLRVGLPEGLTTAAAASALVPSAAISYVEPNGIGAGGATIPDDTHFPAQWHLFNRGQTGGTPSADIQAVSAWDVTIGDPSVVLAVLDTGIDFNHPEFLGRLLPGFDFVNEDPDPTADHPHGIVVTGAAAANADNGFAVAGVDHRCSVLPVKVLNASNFGTVADLVQGLIFSADEGADVISMSLINFPAASSLINALQYARDRGSILVACAGNGGIGNADVSWPGASPLTISVGATDRDDARALFSGTGAALDIVAPGLGVATTSTTYNDTFVNFSGCSAATPIAAGAVTLMKALAPELTHDRARSLLVAGAEDRVGPPGEDTPGRDDFFGHGRLNVWRSLTALPCFTAAAPSPGAGLTRINVDLGANIAFPEPSAGYNGGSPQSGFWNAVSAAAAQQGAQPLSDSDGSATAATIEILGGFGDAEVDDAATGGDDERLLDDYFDAGSALITFRGLESGVYTVFVYAYAPGAGGAASTDIEVIGGLRGGQLVGGAAWAGDFVEGEHFAVDTTEAAAGELTIAVVVPNPPTTSVVNGIQLVRCATDADIYCTAKTALSCGRPTVAVRGVSSASNAGSCCGGTSFEVSVAPTRVQTSGLLLYTNAGPAAFPFEGGLLCIQPTPLRRALPNSAGGVGDCEGLLQIDLNAFASGSLGGNPAPFLSLPGTQVNCQWIARDTLATGALLSEGVAFVVGP